VWTEAEADPETETEAEAEAESEAETESESDTETESESDTETESESESEAETEAETESECETEAETETEAEANPAAFDSGPLRQRLRSRPGNSTVVPAPAHGGQKEGTAVAVASPAEAAAVVTRSGEAKRSTRPRAHAEPPRRGRVDDRRRAG